MRMNRKSPRLQWSEENRAIRLCIGKISGTSHDRNKPTGHFLTAEYDGRDE
jgi:hypothetical protein